MDTGACNNHIGFYVDSFFLNGKLNYYLIFRLYYSYGEELSGYGFSRYLSLKEEDFWLPRFRTLLNLIGVHNVKQDKLKYLEWCFYDGTESYDYYLDEEDTIDMYEKALQKK